MNRFLGIALASVCAGVGCNALSSLSGRCNSDPDCGPGATCDHSTGTGVCVSQLCRPPCNSSQTCDPQTATCKDVTAPEITVTSPGASAFVGVSLQARATARAPGGVSGLIFEVRNAGGTVLASAAGVPVSTGSADYTATVVLSGAAISDGPATLVTRITYQTSKTFETPPVPITIDKTLPVLSMGSYNVATAAWVGPGSPNATVTAQVTDAGAGVDPSTVKLTVLPPGDGTSYTGVPGTGGTYTFTVPIAALGVPDGQSNPSVPYKVDAKDAVGNVGNTLQGQTGQFIRVDRVKPTVNITPDTTWYAGTAAPVTVTASISDADSQPVTTGAAKPFLKIGAGAPVPGTDAGSGNWTFAFDPGAQAPNSEGPVQFTITAQDTAGNVQVAADSRNVDKKPPTVSSLEVFLAGSPDPGQQGVTYPAQPPGAANGMSSGHDGSHFIFSDSVHIKGTFSDNGAGLLVSSLKYRIDGVTAGGAPVTGVEQNIGGSCADGSKNCSFDVLSVPLNDLSKIISFGASTANLTLVFRAKDVVQNDAGTITTPIATTRLWWRRQFTVPTGTVAISGIAIHPNADVIVGTNATAAVETLFALFHDGPFNTLATTRGEDWKKTVGALLAAPVVGPGGSGTATLYIASNTQQTIRALKPDGSDLWSSSSLASFVSTPTVVPNQQINTTTGCEAVLSAGGTRVFAACQDQVTPTQATTTSVSVTDAVVDSPMTFAGGNLFVGTSKRVAQTAFDGTGFLKTAVLFPNSDVGPFSGVASTPSGGTLAAATNNPTTHTAYGITFAGTAFTQVWATDITAAIQGAPSLSGSNVLLDASDAILHSLVASSGVNSTLATLASAGYTPLVGADTNIYVGRNGAIQALSSAGAPLWNMAVPANVTTAPNLDCTGVLYAAAGDTIYAVITDMVSMPTSAGLANDSGVWPKYQRDGRNSGNADAAVKWGIRTGSSTCVQ